MSYEANGLTHYEARSNGQYVMGPLERRDGSMIVRTVVKTDIPFADSESALRHMRSIGRRDPTARVLVNSRHLKMISQNDEF